MKNQSEILSSLLESPTAKLHSGRLIASPFVTLSPPHFPAMYSETMFNFAAAADKLDLTIDEVLDILDLTVEDADNENLTVDEIIEAVEDACDYGPEDCPHGWDSIANHCESYPYN